jgi:A/G-specific adenine glycosylase
MAKVMLNQRAEGGILAGLWEFPGGKYEQVDISLEECLIREVHQKTGLEISVGEKISVFKHAYTHFKISVHAWKVELLSSPPLLLPENFRWVAPSDLHSYPMGKVARKICNKVFDRP